MKKRLAKIALCMSLCIAMFGATTINAATPEQKKRADEIRTKWEQTGNKTGKYKMQISEIRAMGSAYDEDDASTHFWDPSIFTNMIVFTIDDTGVTTEFYFENPMYFYDEDASGDAENEIDAYIDEVQVTADDKNYIKCDVTAKEEDRPILFTVKSKEFNLYNCSVKLKSDDPKVNNQEYTLIMDYDEDTLDYYEEGKDDIGRTENTIPSNMKQSGINMDVSPQTGDTMTSVVLMAGGMSLLSVVGILVYKKRKSAL